MTTAKRVSSQISSGCSRVNDATAAANYHEALLAVHETFAGFAAGIEGEVGPMNFWPHHFDMAFEWFSDAVEVYDEEDGPKEYNKQVGFGFSPGDEGDAQPYFYANPWPFDESFRSVTLPDGAKWHEEGWSGGFLPYTAVAEGGSKLLTDFMRAVINDGEWSTRAVRTGKPMESYRARDLMRSMAEAAWQCGDPGNSIQFRGHSRIVILIIAEDVDDYSRSQFL